MWRARGIILKIWRRPYYAYFLCTRRLISKIVYCIEQLFFALDEGRRVISVTHAWTFQKFARNDMITVYSVHAWTSQWTEILRLNRELQSRILIDIEFSIAILIDQISIRSDGLNFILLFSADFDHRFECIASLWSLINCWLKVLDFFQSWSQLLLLRKSTLFLLLILGLFNLWEDILVMLVKDELLLNFFLLLVLKSIFQRGQSRNSH